MTKKEEECINGKGQTEIEIGDDDDEKKKKYKVYNIAVDPNQGDRAKEIKLCSLSRPHMRAFHFSWIGFFTAFFMWFAIAPLLPEVKETLNLSKKQIWTTNICSVAGTTVMRFINGPLCDKYGARILMSVTLALAAIPTAMTGLVDSFVGLCILRLCIGLAGSTFVMCQYWSTRMFTKEIAGFANSIVGGWGNLGGGVTQIVMGAVLFPLFKSFGMSSETSWRTVSIVPAVFAVGLAWIILKFSDDCPKGNYQEMQKIGIMQQVSATSSFRSGAYNFNTWLLFIHYGCCFGVELTMNNLSALYFSEKFDLSVESAAAIASIFGFMNIFARPLGGYTSDFLNKKMGMRGRLYWQTVCLLIEGCMIFAFANVDNSLGGSIAILVVFSTFVQAAEGSTYGIVPYVNPVATGSIAGIVGAGGNIGAVIFGFCFMNMSYKSGFYTMGGIIFASAGSTALIRIKGHRGLFGGEDSIVVKAAWQGKETKEIDNTLIVPNQNDDGSADVEE